MISLIDCRRKKMMLNSVSILFYSEKKIKINLVNKLKLYRIHKGIKYLESRRGKNSLWVQFFAVNFWKTLYQRFPTCDFNRWPLQVQVKGKPYKVACCLRRINVSTNYGIHFTLLDLTKLNLSSHQLSTISINFVVHLIF